MKARLEIPMYQSIHTENGKKQKSQKERRQQADGGISKFKIQNQDA